MATTKVTTVTYSCDMCGTTSDKPLRGNGKIRTGVDAFGMDGCAWSRDDRDLDACMTCIEKVRTFIAANTVPAPSGADA